MGILTSLFETRQHPSVSVGWERIFSSLGGTTPAGVEVTPYTGLNSAVVYACVRVLAESVASLPLLLYERQAEGGKLRAVGNPLYDLLRLEPNPEQTAFGYTELQMKFLTLWGNALAEIQINGSGRPVALWPLRPDRVRMKRGRGGALLYEVMDSDGGRSILRADQVLHIRGMGSGLWGDSPIRVQMNSIGLDMATEEFGGRFFSNGARPGVVLRHPGVLSDQAYQRLSDSWAARHEGLSNAHRTRILEEGMEVETIGVPPEEAQFLQTRQFQRSVIAGWYRVPPHMVGDLERATFSNIEHQSINFVVHSLRPWLIRIEQEMMRSLFSPAERKRFVVEHLVDGLLRGDTQTRYDAYGQAIQNGFMSRNEVRVRENLNPVDGGDELLIPLNMMPASQANSQNGNNGQADGGQASPDGSVRSLQVTAVAGRSTGKIPEARALTEDDEALLKERQGLARRNVRLFEDAGRRLVRREVADIRRVIDKMLRERGRDAFVEWLDQFYADLRDRIPDYFDAVVRAVAEQAAAAAAVELGQDEPDVDEEFITGYLGNLAGSHVASSNNQIRALMDESQDDNEAADLIEERLSGWEETRPQKIGRGQAFESLNALTIAAYTTLSVQWLRWLSVGNSCEFCQSLSGKVAGIGGFFVTGGDSLVGKSGAVMLVRRNTRHGPIHEGCDCIVVAA